MRLPLLALTLARGVRGEFFAGEPDVPPFVREAYEDPPDR